MHSTSPSVIAFCPVCLGFCHIHGKTPRGIFSANSYLYVTKDLCHFMTLFTLCIQGAEAVYEFFADLQLVLAICLDDDVSCCLVFLAAFLHQVCDEMEQFLFPSRSGLSWLSLTRFKDCLRFCGKENDTAVLLHLNYIALSHRNTTAAGDDNIASWTAFR